MKRILLFLVFTAAFIGKAFSQQHLTWAYAKTYGSSQVELGKRNFADAAGNAYTAGDFQGTTYFTPPSGNGLTATATDAFVCKRDQNGNVIWAFQLGGTGTQTIYDMAGSSNGTFAIVGTFQGTTDFDPSANTSNFTTAGTDAFLAVYDSTSAFQWAIQFTSSSSIEVSSVAFDSNGDLFIGGNFIGFVDMDPGPGTSTITSSGSGSIFYAKYSSAGAFQFAGMPMFTSNSSLDRVYDIEQDGLGNVFLASSFVANSSFHTQISVIHPVSGTEVSTFDIMAPTNNFVIPASIAFDSQNRLIISGQLQGTADFDPSFGQGFFSSTSFSNPMAWMARYTYNGTDLTLNWFNSLSSNNGNRINKVLLDDDDNILACGNFDLSVTPPGLNQYFAYGGSDWFIGKFNGANGNCSWFNTFGSSSVFPETANDLFLLNNTELFVTGNFRETADFDPSDVNVINYTANNVTELDAFSCKYNYVACPPSTAAINPTTCGPYTSPAGNTYTVSGNYTDTLTAASGCDSIIFIGLTVNNGATGPTTTATACDVYYWAPALQYFYNSGSYSYDFPMFNGCDSTIYLDLTIYYSPSVNITNNSGQLSVVGSTGGLTYQWYDCFNNQPIAGETSSTFTPTVSGSYYVVGTTGAGCTEASLCESVTVNGIDDLADFQVQVYPNPSDGLVVVKLSSTGMAKVEVVTILGERVSSFTLSEMESVISLPNESGIYFLKVLQGNKEVIKKVVRN